jgi:preprotein translocase subunit SecE
MAKATAQKGNTKFLKGVKSELKKVSWPNRDEVINYTGIVVAVVTVMALGIWIVDSIFMGAINLFI